MTSDAQKKASKKYHAKFSEFKLRVPCEEGNIVRSHIVETRETVNQFLYRAVKETIERDKEKR